MTKRPQRRMNVYANLAHARKTKKDTIARKKAEYLATLPKHPVKRTLYRMHPKRMAAFWFSKKGGSVILKAAGVSILVAVVFAGGLFAYFRKDIDQIRPSELAKRVQTTVTRYYDRNDVLLWEDKGDGNYKLVVKGSEISTPMKEATIAIEDRDFYNHKGISPTALVRAAINNAQSDTGTQGGSTLTQQLVKQVFFAEEANDRGLSGIPRKIKEVILAIEVERMYNKEQILDLYLNESPYGGRRNGVESAAQTYFGIPAKDLNVAQSALLAAIPNQPGLLDPYNTAGNEALIARQHKVINSMTEEGFITEKEAKAAKDVAILDTIKPETDQYKDIKAPHFVQMVRSELEQKLGKATVGRGGLIVKTTLDARVQDKLQAEMDEMFNSFYPNFAGFSNGAGTIEDVKTGQIIAMLGSRNFNYPGFGQDNAAAAFIQPGSSIKPLVFAELFENKGEDNPNFGSGTVSLTDNPVNIAGYKPQNADGKFKGTITLRNSLALSRNIPAIKAMQVSGVEDTLKLIRAMGNKFYCTQGAEKQAGLSSAIGGCGTRMIDHTNAIASLARGGVYMPTSTVLKVTNSSGEVLEEYKSESKKVLDPQAAYIVNDILGDSGARRGLFGKTITPTLDAANIKTAVKTGTSDIDRKPKDIWTVAYTPSLSGSVWLGNPDTTPLINGNSSIPAQVLDPVMAFATQLYQTEGKAKPGDWFTAPTGIQLINKEVFPSYYDRKSVVGTKLVFDRVSKKKATECTPEAAKIELTVTSTTDPITKNKVLVAPDGYDSTKEDDFHKCGDVAPVISGICIDGDNISIRVTKGTNPLSTIDVTVDGANVASLNATDSGTYTTNYNFPSNKATVAATVTDAGFYTNSATQAYSGNGNCASNASSSRSSDNNQPGRRRG